MTHRRRIPPRARGASDSPWKRVNCASPNTQLALATHIPNQRLDQLDLPTRASFELSGEVTRLDMLDRYLATAFDGQGVRLSGQGSITASATLQDARPYEASLTVQAPTLGAELLELTAQGSGTLDAALSTKEQITAKLAFTDATLRHQERTLLANTELGRRHAAQYPNATTLPCVGVAQPFSAYVKQWHGHQPWAANPHDRATKRRASSSRQRADHRLAT